MLVRRNHDVGAACSDERFPNRTRSGHAATGRQARAAEHAINSAVGLR